MTTSTSLLSRIQSANYIVPVDTIAELARQHTIALNRKDSCAGTYLAILIASLQERARKEPSQEPATLLDTIHKTFYAAILDVLEAMDIDAAMRASRAVFARTAKATLLAYVKAHGSIKDLKPGETSKEWLRKETVHLLSLNGNSAGLSTPTEKANAAIRSAIDSVIELAQLAVKQDNIDEARREIRLAMAMLSDELDALDDLEEDSDDDDEEEEERPRVVAKRLHKTPAANKERSREQIRHHSTQM